MSTIVVIAGLAATAGSPPNLFTIIGKRDPTIVAVTTCIQRAKVIPKAM